MAEKNGVLLSEIKKICDFITRFSFESEIEFIVDRYTNGKSLIKAYKAKTAKYDIIFLDVEMPELNGIETAQLIREFPDRNVLIVFPNISRTALVYKLFSI